MQSWTSHNHTISQFELLSGFVLHNFLWGQLRKILFSCFKHCASVYSSFIKLTLTWAPILLQHSLLPSQCMLPKKVIMFFLIFLLLNVQKYSNSLTQHRRTRNINVPLPQFDILLPPLFLRHLINRVPYVYININKYCCT